MFCHWASRKFCSYHIVLFAGSISYCTKIACVVRFHARLSYYPDDELSVDTMNHMSIFPNETVKMNFPRNSNAAETCMLWRGIYSTTVSWYKLSIWILGCNIRTCHETENHLPTWISYAPPTYEILHVTWMLQSVFCSAQLGGKVLSSFETHSSV